MQILLSDCFFSKNQLNRFTSQSSDSVAYWTVLVSYPATIELKWLKYIGGSMWKPCKQSVRHLSMWKCLSHQRTRKSRTPGFGPQWVARKLWNVTAYVRYASEKHDSEKKHGKELTVGLRSEEKHDKWAKLFKRKTIEEDNVHLLSWWLFEIIISILGFFFLLCLQNSLYCSLQNKMFQYRSFVNIIKKKSINSELLLMRCSGRFSATIVVYSKLLKLTFGQYIVLLIS